MFDHRILSKTSERSRLWIKNWPPQSYYQVLLPQQCMWSTAPTLLCVPLRVYYETRKTAITNGASVKWDIRKRAVAAPYFSYMILRWEAPTMNTTDWSITWPKTMKFINWIYWVTVCPINRPWHIPIFYTNSLSTTLSWTWLRERHP